MDGSRPRRQGAGLWASLLCRVSRRCCAGFARWPTEKDGELFSLVSFALDQLGQRKGFASEPAALNGAPLLIDLVPDELNCGLVAADGFVGEPFRVPTIDRLAAEGINKR